MKSIPLAGFASALLLLSTGTAMANARPRNCSTMALASTIGWTDAASASNTA